MLRRHAIHASGGRKKSELAVELMRLMRAQVRISPRYPRPLHPLHPLHPLQRARYQADGAKCARQGLSKPDEPAVATEPPAACATGANTMATATVTTASTTGPGGIGGSAALGSPSLVVRRGHQAHAVYILCTYRALAIIRTMNLPRLPVHTTPTDRLWRMLPCMRYAPAMHMPLYIHVHGRPGSGTCAADRWRMTTTRRSPPRRRRGMYHACTCMHHTCATHVPPERVGAVMSVLCVYYACTMHIPCACRRICSCSAW